MLNFLQGNLLEAPVEALVNTVNTVGIMGKGIALMFKEAYPANFKQYERACAEKTIHVGKVFATETGKLAGPKWIINFPTKKHWRQPSKLEWITEGLQDLRRFIVDHHLKSIALPPLGCGNGGLDWGSVKHEISRELQSLDIDIFVFEPTDQYQNVAKKFGVESLTPARALIAEMIRRYWILGIECTYLEVQKLCWFLERSIQTKGFENVLALEFKADEYGPYSDRLRHLLDKLDGSYLHCDKRLSDAGPSDTIWLDENRRGRIDLFLNQEENQYLGKTLDRTAALIDGFESPLGLELLATVDWLVQREHCEPTLKGVTDGLRSWPAGEASAHRKLKLFDTRLLSLGIERLNDFSLDVKQPST